MPHGNGHASSEADCTQPKNSQTSCQILKTTPKDLKERQTSDPSLFTEEAHSNRFFTVFIELRHLKRAITGSRILQPSIPLPLNHICSSSATPTMADGLGYMIIRKAVPLIRTQEVAAAIDRGLSPLAVRDKFTEFQVPAAGFAVRDEFIKVRPCLSLQMLDVDCNRLENLHSKTSSRSKRFQLCPNQSTSEPFTQRYLTRPS